MLQSSKWPLRVETGTEQEGKISVSSSDFFSSLVYHLELLEADFSLLGHTLQSVSSRRAGVGLPITDRVDDRVMCAAEREFGEVLERVDAVIFQQPPDGDPTPECVPVDRDKALSLQVIQTANFVPVGATEDHSPEDRVWFPISEVIKSCDPLYSETDR